MILCLDCGNTRLKWGLRTGTAWAAQGALPLADAEQLRGCLPEQVHIDLAVGCIVAGSLAQSAIEAALPCKPVWNMARAAQCGVSNRYENPAQLGADRWAALIGARALHDGACLVVTAGTATTIDLLDADGVFQGGLILPGLDLMRSALSGNTALLPAEPGNYRMLPRNTLDAISSGAIHATLGAIERLFGLISNTPHPICLLSGGAAEFLTREIKLPCRLVHNLALEGLVRIAQESPAGA